MNLPDMKGEGPIRVFNTREEVETLDEAGAEAVVRNAYDCLRGVVEGCHAVIGLDDTGDYLAAAIDNYFLLFHAYWDHDGTDFVDAVKRFLLTSPNDHDNDGSFEFPWGGSDGEIRFTLCPWWEEELS